ncbi:hypothetical protein L3X38_024992 [Prunus dulcis]|uniref:Uncharacterized protein n=1 Tax=Prunus dulcis TaxID=3755 RepID=A0AAD4W0T6_PRUDU|nr:hypothetical protein L3X38_024992 [Prunus dulcis]
MLLGDDIGESTEGTKIEFTLGDIDLDQPTAVLSQLNVWLNDKGKAVEQGVQLRKRKRIIPMWKIIEDSKVSLIPDEILKEELAPLSITIPNLLNTVDFYEEGVYANNCSLDWLCPWPIERVDVQQQSNQ